MKKIFKIIKLQIKGGQANPSPPVGPALGSAGVNILDFCKNFNKKTEDQKGKLIPVVITIYEDKSFDFLLKTLPVSIQLMNYAKIKKGSKEPNRIKVGNISLNKITEIAKNKMIDLNCFTIDSAISMMKGTARSMGLEIKKETLKKSNKDG